MIDADVSLNGVIGLTVPFAWSLIEVESVPALAGRYIA